ncbi:MAG: tetratricopeptide repeat protein [Bacteroidetes bacterium]|nr:tetratricopeptide repeat protein [Bacteroidota bacterium]
MKQKDGSEYQNLNEPKFVLFTNVFDISKNGIILFFLCAVPIVLYYRTINYEFVWDDIHHLITNQYLNPVNFENLSHFWKEVHWGLYIPVSYTLWAFIKELSLLLNQTPDSTHLFHLVNILLHIINGLLVFTLLRQFIKNSWYALIGALFFLLHPIQIETVAWISEFRGLLSFTFGFSALYQYLKGCYYKYNDHDLKLSLRYYIYGWLLFVAALLSKPSMVVILFFAPILEYYLYHTPLKKLLIRILPYLLPVLVITIVTMLEQGNTATHPYPLWIRPFVFSDSLLFYLKKIFVPFDYAASYGRTMIYLEGKWWFYSSWLLLLGLGALMYKFRKKYQLIILGAVLFVFGLLTVSGLIRFDFQVWSNVADRYIYISMFGMALILSSFLEQMSFNKKYFFLISSICLVGLSMVTWLQIPVWKNDLTLWSNGIRIVPQNSYSWNNRGVYYFGQKQYDEALIDFQKSIELDSNFSHPYYNKGLIYIELNKYDEAILNLNLAISFDQSNDKDFFIKRAETYIQLKRYENAIQDYNRVIVMGGGNTVLYNHLGFTNLMAGSYDSAIMNFNKSILLDPKNESAYYNRGIAYTNLKKYDLAIQDYEKAIQLNPRYEKAISALEMVSKIKLNTQTEK